ncbi:hypothetical protein C8D92_102344 [Tamilnaduibacter salinus]|uniref:PcRGLX/YetA-like N-terminal RIFT barrel domain-containing protein n=1 Tax=Tamilnaduibacter salinus TaxID=1484056 RepID=A0A2U1CZV4_9GAMM|nr:hypothetical protein [Tamilnaduibacter salinus]PVY78303.1 hypothetical protein C8D92_102344 [Tamilnaduibacter salinus]
MSPTIDAENTVTEPDASADPAHAGNPLATIAFCRQGATAAPYPHPVCVGVPLAEGQLSPDQPLALSDRETTLPLQTAPLAHWPDGSVRWLRVESLVAFTGDSMPTLTLSPSGPDASGPPIRVTETDDGIDVFNGVRHFHFPKQSAEWHSRSEEGIRIAAPELTTADGQPCEAQVLTAWHLLDQGPVRVRLSMTANWRTAQEGMLAKSTITVDIFRDSETVRSAIDLHNPRRARHPGGLWDLGDPGSVHFQSLVIRLRSDRMSQSWVRPHPDDAGIEGDGELLIYQDSSGGEHWDSRNHIDADSRVTTTFRGFKLVRQGETVFRGDRAEPVLGVADRLGEVQVCMDHFWQNFPSALEADREGIQIGLFPRQTATPYELQGGERKTQQCHIHFGTDRDALTGCFHPPVPVIDASHYEQTQAFPWFAARETHGPLEDLIQAGIDGPNNFFAKREVIDEYGWRNFGELFADHETLYQAPGEAPFISHYNNQYDPIYGFARQFARTGDPRWFELMDDLARHVRDIDIYHTDDDRVEYNHGLFWHTDHYLDAHTATHRTFTRHNDTSSTPGQTGGGPAAEHCYTTGLLYHYFLTGDTDSRDAVLELAHWMVANQEGQGGFLEQVLALKKQDLPRVKAKLRGETVTAHQYPFTRATGNYLNALLDAWTLTGDSQWLKRAEAVIAKTIHPADDPDLRNLLDVETGWSYLVFMASLAKYIDLKRANGDTGGLFSYAVAAFRQYARWMVEHERPFLEDPEPLEFPNDTWTAQEIRKILIMRLAAAFDPENRTHYEGKAQEWTEAMTIRLADSPESGFTRILCILMQNYGAYDRIQPIALTDSTPNTGDSTPILTWRTLTLRIIQRMMRGIGTFQPAKERAWLNARLERGS